MHPLTILTLALCSSSLSSAFSLSNLVPDVIRRSVSLSNSLEKRETQAQLTLCRDFGGPDAPGNVCTNFDLDENQFKGGFEFDKAGINNLVGAAPSSAKLNTPGTICGIGTKIEHDVKFFLNFVPRCRGERMLILESGFKDFPGELNDNMGCIACFKSPTS